MGRQTKRFQQQTTRLHNAALEGDIPSLLNLLQEDPLILDRYMIEKSSHFKQSPLHVAVNAGHLEFTTEILRHKPELAEELDQFKGWSPLHLASKKGYLEIVKALLVVNPDMCFARDQDGRNPIHVAAINDQNHVLEVLLQSKPQAALERTNSGETVLHLCVKHSRPEALMFVVNVTDDAELLNSKDGDGNTVLHLAVAARQPEVVKFLLKHTRMEINAMNSNGSTAMDVSIRRSKEVNGREIWQSLKRGKALKAKDSPKLQNNDNHTWLEKQRNALMVVASLIATMAFQAGTNPPRGAWQDTQGDNYYVLISINTVALISSLSVILLLISGLPCKQLFVVILMVTMWVAISAITLTYSLLISYFDVGPVFIAFIAWLTLMFILLLSHAIRAIVRLYKRCYTRPTNYP